jgi:pimeloyl-ACP methyl ester carboxylesterase
MAQAASCLPDPGESAVYPGWIQRRRARTALIIRGDWDTIIPLRGGEYLRSILPNAELIVMKGVNYIPYVEDNGKFFEIAPDLLSR